MGWVFLWLALGFASQLWLCLRVGRSSVPLAIASFLLGPFGALYTVFKHHGDERLSVSVPFVANCTFSVLLVMSVWQLFGDALAAEIAGQAVEAKVGDSSGEVAVVPAVAQAASAPAAALPMPATAASSVAAAETAAAPPDPIDLFSAQLREAGLAHSLTRLGTDTAIPRGVMDAAQVAIGPVGTDTLSGTLFRCAGVANCRELAGAYKLQSSRRHAEPKQVLQNGVLLLVVTQAGSEPSALQNVVQGVFRRTVL